MWPSLETASHIFDLAGFILVGALTVGVVCTILIVWMGIVKEHHWDDEKRRSAERISANEAETARAVADSDKAKEGAALANERAAEANARALEAQLALEKFKAPRALSPEQVDAIVGALSRFSGQEFQITTYWEATEPMALSQQIGDTLTRASWRFVPHVRWQGLFGGIEGVIVYTHPHAPPEVQAAKKALVEALSRASIVAIEKEEAANNNPVHNRINLQVGQKPR